MMPKTFPVDELRRLLAYDPTTGAFTWRVNRSFRAMAGTVAGSTNKRGYVAISLGDRIFQAHRVAWAWMTGTWPDLEIDHVSGVRSDNSWDNLRLANDTQQVGNRKVSANNTSGIKGVRFCRTKKRWIAQIGIASRQKTLGHFDTKEDAAAAYAAAATAHFGEFARIA